MINQRHSLHTKGEVICLEKREKNKVCPVTEEIPPVLVAIDNDLAVENLENDFDMTAADRQDLQERTE